MKIMEFIEASIRLLPIDSLQCVCAAAVVQLFEPGEAVAADAHGRAKPPCCFQKRSPCPLCA